jgi:hypothetical protein
MASLVLATPTPRTVLRRGKAAMHTHLHPLASHLRHCPIIKLRHHHIFPSPSHHDEQIELADVYVQDCNFLTHCIFMTFRDRRDSEQVIGQPGLTHDVNFQSRRVNIPLVGPVPVPPHRIRKSVLNL